ncbi:MAG: dTMP kinase [Candidatus Parvarchaeota archaeon]|jgi:dTMP kinase|nr:dTMP kinase [Candidatus Parvarchaeota archaeon]MCL5101020.1 dTMP kinase [Candidatus Parvarchaeota archaeon]
MKGKFIVLEGLDGAGLATQAALLAQHLKQIGYPVLLTKEPTNSIIGGLSKAALKGEFLTTSKTLQLLFCADRAHHLEKEIEPALSHGKIVVCDRYLFSTLAYGYASKVNYKWLRYVNLNFRLPDIGLFIDVKPSTSIIRISDEDSGIQLFDEKQQLEKVRQAYSQVAREFHLKKIDGGASIGDISTKINKMVDKLMSV